MPFDGRKLILEAAGGFLPGENTKGYLRRVAQDFDIGFRSLERFWKGQYGSKKTVSKLEQKARNNADKVAATLELASRLERLAGTAPASDAEILRAAADTLRHGVVREA